MRQVKLEGLNPDIYVRCDGTCIGRQQARHGPLLCTCLNGAVTALELLF